MTFTIQNQESNLMDMIINNHHTIPIERKFNLKSSHGKININHIKSTHNPQKEISKSNHGMINNVIKFWKNQELSIINKIN